MKATFCGIDPGKNGGIAFLEEDGTVYTVLRMPETERDIADVFGPGCPPIKLVMLEKAQVYPAKFNPREGEERRQGTVSSGKYMQGYGFLRGLLTGLKIGFDEVAPITWQRYLGCLTHGDKTISKSKAQQLFPGLRVTHATADALLIARFCRQKDLGILPPPIKVIRRVVADPRQGKIPMTGNEGVEDF